MPLSLLTLGIACFDVESFLADVTNDTVLAAAVVGVERSENMDLDGTLFDGTAVAGVTLRNLEGEALPGSVTVASTSNGVRPLEAMDEGWVTSDLGYVVGETLTLALDGEDVMWTEAAPAAQVVLPERVAPGAEITVDLSEQDFDVALVALVRLDEEAEVWTNLPDDASALLDSDEDLLVVDVDPAAVVAGRYALGVCGLRLNAPSEVSGVNTFASMMGTGVLSFRTLEVSD